MTIKVHWEEPPAPASGRGKSKERQQLLAILQSNSGEWARVQDNVKGASATSVWKKYGCESVARKAPTGGGFHIYARWPEPDPATVDPYVRARRMRGVPSEGKAA